MKCSCERQVHKCAYFFLNLLITIVSESIACSASFSLCVGVIFGTYI
ncbi:hypothetical protein ACJIZ3_004222 [Penstemon smallii]|uniref:Uncharacterized protein n=1 Tax=Penstemon smallii TaxID=265156 RepID=A0ABD3S1K8_9LAMI